MGLIEKAISLEEVKARRAAAEKAQSSPGPNDTPNDAPNAGPHAGPGAFDLDFELLAAKGFYTPDAADSAQALELRAIKRRLLRRTGFLQRAGQDRLALARSGRPRNLVLVTSTRPGEGKTFSAINLALSLAIEDNREILLVDGDIPRPKIKTSLGLSAERGFSDALGAPDADPADYCLRANQAPLSVLPEGAPVRDGASLLASAEGKQFFAKLSQADPSRLVIVDAPPMLATTEALVLAKLVDEVVFVVEADATPEPAAAAALDELLEINPNVSLILNRCLIAAGGSHYGAYEYYERKSSNEAGARDDSARQGLGPKGEGTK